MGPSATKPPVSPYLSQAFDAAFLNDIGLSAGESQLYRVLLRVGAKPASELSKLSGISRTNTYNVLTQLEGKGIIDRRSGGTKKIFAALHPRRIEQVLETQEQRVKKMPRNTRRRDSKPHRRLFSC